MYYAHGKEAKFAAINNPIIGNEPSEIEDISLTTHEEGEYLVRIRLRDGGEELYSYDPSGNLRVVEGIETSTKLFCLCRENDGKFRILTKD